MTKEQIREAVIIFCRGFWKVSDKLSTEFFQNPQDYKIICRQETDSISIVLTYEPSTKVLAAADVLFHIDLPEFISPKEEDIVLEIGMILYERLIRYYASKKANASRGAQARKASARKAIEARWSKNR